MSEVNYVPRNANVVVRVVNVGKTKGGVYAPDGAREGKEYHVVAIGPKVEDLAPGDKVMMTGVQKVDWDFLPGERDLLMIPEGNIIAKVVPVGLVPYREPLSVLEGD